MENLLFSRFALADFGRPFVHGAMQCIQVVGRWFAFVCIEL